MPSSGADYKPVVYLVTTNQSGVAEQLVTNADFKSVDFSSGVKNPQEYSRYLLQMPQIRTF
ncbi:MAG: hypothetical protein LBP35_05485 [Candidatus Ancillula trichonymphae]|nr:hypothetical protein [Candidatus Ancillula trichonymphae]